MKTFKLVLLNCSKVNQKFLLWMIELFIREQNHTCTVQKKGGTMLNSTSSYVGVN